MSLKLVKAILHSNLTQFIPITPKKRLLIEVWDGIGSNETEHEPTVHTRRLVAPVERSTLNLRQMKWVCGFDSQMGRTEIWGIKLTSIKSIIIKYLPSF